MVAQIAENITPDRLNPDQDMPAGLEPWERMTYRKGYARGALAYVRKHGGPGVVHNGDAPAAGTPERAELGRKLAELTRAHEIERHPTAHRAGMSALNRRRKALGLERVTDTATGTRTRTRKPAPVAEPAAPVDVAPTVDQAPAAPVLRIVPAPEPVAEPVETPAPVDVAPAVVETPATSRVNRTRKLARRELAETMRARGEDPSDPGAWAAAKLAAGVK